jgi:hypothetical protein
LIESYADRTKRIKMKERMCNLLEPCETPEAPLCPIQVNTIKHGIWYPGEPVCRSKRFSYLLWLQKQRKIARLKLNEEAGFFTVRILEEIHTINRNIRGANPDEPDAEQKWLAQKEEKRASKRSRKHRSGSKESTEPETIRKDMLL